MIFHKKFKVISKQCQVISIKNFYLLNKKQKNSIEKNILFNCIHHLSESSGYNFVIEDNIDPFFEKLYKKYLSTCKKIFKNFTFKSRSEYFCYLSSAGNYNCFYHDHKKTGTITGVYYFQLNERDSISFLTDGNQEFKYYPSEGELLFFPSYRVHKPNPPIYAQRTRYSINIDIFTEESSEELFNHDI
jgi:hypothetical protein